MTQNMFVWKTQYNVNKHLLWSGCNLCLFYATVTSHFKQWEPWRTGETKGDVQWPSVSESLPKKPSKQNLLLRFKVSACSSWKVIQERILANSRSTPLMEGLRFKYIFSIFQVYFPLILLVKSSSLEHIYMPPLSSNSALPPM